MCLLEGKNYFLNLLARTFVWLASDRQNTNCFLKYSIVGVNDIESISSVVFFHRIHVVLLKGTSFNFTNFKC